MSRFLLENTLSFQDKSIVFLVGIKGGAPETFRLINLWVNIIRAAIYEMEMTKESNMKVWR